MIIVQAKMSHFLQSSKPLLKNIIESLQNDFPYVSILGTDTFGTSYRVQKNNISLEDSFWNERGFVVRAYNGTNYSEFSFNELCEDSMDNLIDKIKSALKSEKNIIKSGIPVNEYPLIKEESIKRSFYGEVKKDPCEMSSKEKLDKMQSIMNKAFEKSKELIDFRVNYSEIHISKVFLSKNKDLEQSYIIGEGYLIPMVRRNNNIKYTFKGYSGLKSIEIFDEMEKDIDSAITDTLELLDAKPVKPGEYDVICCPEISGLIAREAFGHGVEMDMFVKNRAKAAQYIGKPVASSIVTMHDGAAAAKDVSSYMFDDEGTLASDTVIIKNGILETGMCDILTAMKLGITPTGNGKRQSFERKAYTRMTNTFFSCGNAKLEDMIKSIKYGFMLDKEMSGMEDPKNWGIQCMLIRGREIKDGKLTGKIVSPIILTGYVPDLLKSISMVSGDFELFGTGACGKGYKEYVKVSDGGPYIKAKVRLG